MHTAIGIGNANLNYVGTPGSCMQFFITGPVMDIVSSALSISRAGEIVCSESVKVVTANAPGFRLSDWKPSPLSDNFFLYNGSDFDKDNNSKMKVEISPKTKAHRRSINGVYSKSKYEKFRSKLLAPKR